MNFLTSDNILNLLEQYSIPGCSIALIEDMKLAYQNGFGIINLARRDPVNVNTVFECASISKILFAYAILKFFKNKKLSIDEPLVNYYPCTYTEWSFSSDNPNIKLVTARHILSHTSGFSNWDNFEGLHAGKLRFVPGNGFYYSGEGFIYLQRILEFLSGYPLAEYMKKNIFIPFNMPSSSYVWLDRYSKNIADGHGKRNYGLDSYWSEGFSAYSLYSTPTDIANFLIEIISADKGDEFRLDKNEIKNMLLPQISVTPYCSWALGWGIEHTPHGDYFWQWGDAGNYQCYVLGSVKQRWGLVVMTNSENGLKFSEKLIHEISQKDHPCTLTTFLQNL